MRLIKRESKGSLRAGQDLVMVGYAGREGARRIAFAREDELLSWFSRDYISLMQQKDEFEIDETIPWQEYGASEWESVGKGGIFTALWNLSGAYTTGFEVDLYKIPIRQETVEVSSYMYMACAGLNNKFHNDILSSFTELNQQNYNDSIFYFRGFAIFFQVVAEK